MQPTLVLQGRRREEGGHSKRLRQGGRSLRRAMQQATLALQSAEIRSESWGEARGDSPVTDMRYVTYLLLTKCM